MRQYEKQYKKIVLNIPHASKLMTPLTCGWTDKNALQKHIDRWTDWKTDLLFTVKDERIIPVIAKWSRFMVDCERLEDDPLEEIGQGIIYTKFEDCTRRPLTKFLQDALMDEYHKHINALKQELTPNSLLIDCHSFPSDLSDVDVCIGFNYDDWSTPDDKTVYTIKSVFEDAGYRTEYNEPYGNSISPKTDFKYASVMINLNKRTYLDENTLQFIPEGRKKMKATISECYKQLFKL